VSKLVFLKISEGSFEQGFSVTLQIGEEQADQAGQLAYRLTAEVIGKLPPSPGLLQSHQRWQSRYRHLGIQSRLHAPKVQVTNVSITHDCECAAQELSDRLNEWLRSESFRPIREKWLEQLSVQDNIRVILQSDHPVMQRLPWQVWDVLERYKHAELALSAPSYDRTNRPIATKPRIQILAILGNSQGIDVQADRRFLEQLPEADVRFLVEPSRQTLNDHLWQQSWDILFFAGHSTSEANNSSGAIKINQTDSLTIAQLKYALRNAVDRGLSLAIFNSCDGLGLAHNLAELHIPQMIVMREPIPDRVAQTFLKAFITTFAHGQTLYRSVREAREQLQGLEHQFPCATWLPVICQNPTESPATWQGLKGQITTIAEAAESLSQAKPLATGRSRVGWWQAIGLGLLIGLSIVGVRSTGALQAWELAAYDQTLRMRPPEPLDDRLLIVTIDEAERQTYGEAHPEFGWISLSDRVLNQLLQQLETYRPRLIGLDLYRDFPIATDQASLTRQFQQNSNLVAVCKARFLGDDSIAPPPDIPLDRVGFSDFVVDEDDRLRRHLLTMTPELIDPGIPCTSPHAFSVQLATRYLQAQGLVVDRSAPSWQIANLTLPLLQPFSGGYWQADTQGQQILLNYRMNTRPASQVSLTEVISGQVNPEIVRDRIVFIGVTAKSAGDVWQTPIDQQMPGVVVQAHMVSQLLSAALDNRSLLWSWSNLVEGIWITLWAIVGSGCGWLIQRLVRLGLSLLLASGLLIGLCWLMMVIGGWIPLVPTVMAIAVSGLVTRGYRRVGRRSSKQSS
jgi:CHASE2 domain-containing sensor protein